MLAGEELREFPGRDEAGRGERGPELLRPLDHELQETAPGALSRSDDDGLRKVEEDASLGALDEQIRGKRERRGFPTKKVNGTQMDSFAGLRGTL